jgi:UDP-N-acetylmuramyl pentapeptide synthase
MLNFVSKLKFLFRRPKVVVVAGNGRQTAKEAIFQVLNSRFKIDQEVLLLETDLEDIGEIKFYLKNSSLPVLVVSHLGDIPPDKIFFAGKRNEKIWALAKEMPSQGYLVLNFDDETVRGIKDETNLINKLTFGFQERADFKASDICLNGGTNFKVNHKGYVVPVWLNKLFGKEQIYAALAAASCGNIFGLNLVEVSQALKNYHST